MGNKHSSISSIDIAELTEQVNSSIQKITENVEFLEAVSSQLDDERRQAQQRSELIEQVRRDTNILGNDMSIKFQELRSLKMSANKSKQVEKLAGNFTTILQTFQKMLEEVASKIRDNDVTQPKRESGTEECGDRRFSTSDRDVREFQSSQLERPNQNQMTFYNEDQLQLEFLSEHEEMRILSDDILFVKEMLKDITTVMGDSADSDECLSEVDRILESASNTLEESKRRLYRSIDSENAA